jgi:hypothetical protein
MSLRRLLPTLDNAGRRLVLAEVLGQPVSMKIKRELTQRSKLKAPSDVQPSGSSADVSSAPSPTPALEEGGEPHE